MPWFNKKEVMAGRKRLFLTYYIYKFLGPAPVYLIAFFVSFFAFLFSKKLRKYSKQNLKVITGKNPTLLECFAPVLNYAFSLADKMAVFSKKFDPKNISFKKEDKNFLDSCIKNKKGIFFICTHTGNIETMRALCKKDQTPVNIFLSKKQSQIFNNFLSQIEKKENISVFETENIGVEIGITIKERLDKGEFVFIAGDRVSENNTASFEADFFNHKVKFPKGTFKFAELTESIVVFIAAIKRGALCGKYEVIMQQFLSNEKLSKKENLQKMQKDYVLFLENVTRLAPNQFYHFYEIFDSV